MQIKAMEVNTPLGTIKVEPTNDTSYPGVWISVGGQRLVLIDYTSTSDQQEQNVSVRIWNPKTDEDDYLAKYILRGNGV